MKLPVVYLLATYAGSIVHKGMPAHKGMKLFDDSSMAAYIKRVFTAI